MPSEERVTLLRPPEPDPRRAPVENAVEVTRLSVLGPDIFTNTRQPWQPRGARGIFGGAVIAQSLAAAHLTVPNDYLCHSCHCYFFLAGAAGVPILYHVERVRDGRSFATRTVQARQKGRCIFTTTISFVRSNPADDEAKARETRHAADMPEGVAETCPTDDWDGEPDFARYGAVQNAGMKVTRAGDDGARPQDRRCRQWSRVRGRISPEGGHQAHLNALAYMSDGSFIGTVSRIHGLWPYYVPDPTKLGELSEEDRQKVEHRARHEAGLTGPWESWGERPRVGMVVSLDHSIYFHEPRRVRADEWMFAEMESPWAGDGRGMVVQKIFAKDGTLLATCTQEGVVRLRREEKL